jgi:hypothetical protein
MYVEAQKGNIIANCIFFSKNPDSGKFLKEFPSAISREEPDVIDGIQFIHDFA